MTRLLEKRINKRKETQACQYNKRHRSFRLRTLDVNDTVWIIDLRVYAVVIRKLQQPNSFLLKTERGSVIRRNRWHLVDAPYYKIQVPTNDFTSAIIDDPIITHNNNDFIDNDNLNHAQDVPEVRDRVENDVPPANLPAQRLRPIRNCGPPQFYGNVVRHD